jgi:DNA-binding XRE family transcriptional regulator
MMRSGKKKALESRGWKVGTAEEFLELSPEEAAYIEMKLALAGALKEQRRRKKLTQTQLAQRIESSQSRVAKMEAADPTVSIDLLLRSLLALGVTKRDLAKTISASDSKAA